MMGGLLQRYELAEAVIQTLRAGCDLVLLRDESPIRWLIPDRIEQAVRAGDLSETQLDGSVRRILAMRYDMGLAENGGQVDTATADRFDDPVVVDAADHMAAASVLQVRDDADLLPLDDQAKVLLIEQVFPTHDRVNDTYIHPGLLWRELCALGAKVDSVEIGLVPSDKDRQRVRHRLEEGDYAAVICTNYYYHKAASSNSELVAEILAKGLPLAVVANTVYAFGVPEDAPTVLTCFHPGGREQLRVLAEALYGRRILSATMPV